MVPLGSRSQMSKRFLNNFGQERPQLFSKTRQALDLLQGDLDSWELEQLLSGKYDNCGCRLTIMAGAGGTEAQDWAQMLQRMYLRFFQRRGFKYKIVEEEVRGDGRRIVGRRVIRKQKEKQRRKEGRMLCSI